jgi:GNAT superfamily N-acetyltransferase
VDLTGQVCSDSIGGKFYSGFGGQVDFIRGAARSEGGKPIIALPSTTKDEKISRICSWLKTGAGVVTSRADVHYVVTEYGVAYLHGKSVRERALALIHIAHPRFRDELMREARAARLVHPNQVALPPGLQPYPRKYESQQEFAQDLKVAFRPIQPSDERALKDLFYSHSPSTIYQRYFSDIKHLSHETVQRMVTLDYRNAMAIVGEIPWEGRHKLIAVGRYYRDPATNWAEVAVVVQENYRQRGLAVYLLRQLAKIAAEQGIVGFTADVLPDNTAMFNSFRKVAAPVEIQGREPKIRKRITVAAFPAIHPSRLW